MGTLRGSCSSAPAVYCLVPYRRSNSFALPPPSIPLAGGRGCGRQLRRAAHDRFRPAPPPPLKGAANHTTRLGGVALLCYVPPLAPAASHLVRRWQCQQGDESRGTALFTRYAAVHAGICFVGVWVRFACRPLCTRGGGGAQVVGGRVDGRCGRLQEQVATASTGTWRSCVAGDDRPGWWLWPLRPDGRVSECMWENAWYGAVQPCHQPGSGEGGRSCLREGCGSGHSRATHSCG